MKISLKELTEMVMNNDVYEHHEAIAKGYQKITPTIEEYHGKFGKGFRLHIPTLRSNIRCKSFHFVKYFIYNN